MMRSRRRMGFICVVSVTLFSVWYLTLRRTIQYSTAQNCPNLRVLQEEETERTMKRIKKVKLLCWLATMRDNLDNKTIFVKKTWGKRCDVLLFFGSEEMPGFKVIDVNVTEGREHLSEKTYAAFRHIYHHYMDKADWFLKADDDTYVIVDNLKYFLSSLDTYAAVWFGYRFNIGFNSGGAGYVLSKEALIRFGEQGHDDKVCPYKSGAEDMDMGQCMKNLRVRNVNTLDEQNRTRFHASNPWTHIHADQTWILKVKYTCSA